MAKRRDWHRLNASIAARRAVDPHPITQATETRGDRSCAVCDLRRETITITDGMLDDGTLRVVTFCCVAHARQGGYPWVPLRKSA